MTTNHETGGSNSSGTTMKTSIKKCARCGEDHDDLEMRKFKRSVEDEGKLLYDYWAWCPVSAEPILVLVYEVSVS